MLVFVSQTVVTKHDEMVLTIDIYFLSSECWKVREAQVSGEGFLHGMRMANIHDYVLTWEQSSVESKLSSASTSRPPPFFFLKTIQLVMNPVSGYGHFGS